jgi:hypothetical protein
MSDALIVLGNEWTASTYREYSDAPIFSLNATAYKSNMVLERKFPETKYNLLWFGSSGLVHKGLDLCLEFVERNHNFNLHICGRYESDFFEVWSKAIDGERVNYYGLIDTSSDTFREICQKCAFVISPTCSEGQSTSLLTCMNAGIIPVATAQSGVDLDEVGFLIDDLTEEAVSRAIFRAVSSPDEELIQMSQLCRKKTLEEHSIDNFKASLKTVLSKLI